MSKPQYYEIIENINTPEDLISRNIKTQTLNAMTVELSALKSSTDSKLITNKIDYISSSLEDAYKIDMYKFQFKVYVDIMSKEIKDVKNSITVS